MLIDIRDNGGGSIPNALKDLLYTHDEVIELYVTKDNIASFERIYGEIKENVEQYGRWTLKYLRKEIKKMKKTELNTFMPRSSGTNTITMDSVWIHPKRVGVLYNKGCASSCESLLFIAKKSKKAVLLGENSGGYVGYGENLQEETPCYQFRLFCTRSRYRIQRKYEVGIQPDILKIR